jgi:hypothetical protein
MERLLQKQLTAADFFHTIINPLPGNLGECKLIDQKLSHILPAKAGRGVVLAGQEAT